MRGDNSRNISSFFDSNGHLKASVNETRHKIHSCWSPRVLKSAHAVQMIVECACINTLSVSGQANTHKDKKKKKEEVVEVEEEEEETTEQVEEDEKEEAEEE